MVSLGRPSTVWRFTLVLGCIAGCAGATADLETTRLRSICALAALDGRLDLLPTGPGLLSARVVTLNRQAALEAIQGLDDDQPTGLTKVRVEGPRPLLAVVLQLEDAAGAVFLRHPITLAIARERWDQERREKLEAWVFDQGGSVIHMDAPPAEELSEALLGQPGVDLRGGQPLSAGLARGMALAEDRGAAWVYGRYDHPTIRALNRALAEQPERVHLVGIERITRPPTAPAWRRRCPE